MALLLGRELGCCQHRAAGTRFSVSARQIGRSVPRLSVIVQSAFDDDPNSSEPSTSSSQSSDASNQRRPLRGVQAGRGRGMAGRGGGRGGNRRDKPSKEQLLAMGYDDVDDFGACVRAHHLALSCMQAHPL